MTTRWITRTSGGPVSIELQQSLGGQPGSFSEGSTSSGSLYYTASALNLGVMAQQSKDAASHKLVIGSAGRNLCSGTGEVLRLLHLCET